MLNLIKPIHAADDVVGKLDLTGSGLIVDPAKLGEKLLTPVIAIIIVIAGIWAFLQIVLGGMGFITAGGDPKKIQEAQNKLVHSIIGLAIIAISFAIAALIGLIFFGDAGFILNPTIKTQ